MLFKQGVLKEEKIKFTFLLAIDSFPTLLLILASLRGESMLAISVLLPISIVCVLIPGLILDLRCLEQYLVYEDRIEVICPLGKKNTVLFKEVKSIEELEISLTTRSVNKAFYIFDDGRKNTKNTFRANSCYNSKKYNLRIYKTEELESFIKDKLSMDIHKAVKQ